MADCHERYGHQHLHIELTETTGNDYKIIPGVDIKKDPKVTVTKDSEACWLFVKVETTGTFVADKVTYSVRTGAGEWTALEGNSGVYYREVSAEDAEKGVEYYVLTGNDTYKNGVVTVKDSLTKEDIKGINGAVLKFTAYAVQKDGIDDAATAWGKVPQTTNP